MKILKKTLIICALFICFSISSAFADPESQSDCDIFGLMNYYTGGKIGFDIVDNARETNSNYLSGFLTIDKQRTIITKNDLNTALLNLKKQCCLKKEFSKLPSCTDEKIFFNENTLESELLFNHLFDVIMRRLNGLNGDNDIYIRSKMSLDNLGAERRERITSQATSNKGATPQTISTKYNQFRTQTKKYDISDAIYSSFSRDKDRFLFFVAGKGTGDAKNESEKTAKALQEYENRTLYDRYKNSCALSEYFYILLGGDRSKNQPSMTKIKSSCNKFIENQISGENEYVQLVTKRSANLFLSNYIQGYMSYMFERQMTLQKLRKDSTDRFLDVVNGVPCLENQCTH